MTESRSISVAISAIVPSTLYQPLNPVSGPAGSDLFNGKSECWVAAGKRTRAEGNKKRRTKQVRAAGAICWCLCDPG